MTQVRPTVSSDYVQLYDQRLPQGELYKRLVRSQKQLASPPVGLVPEDKKIRAAS